MSLLLSLLGRPSGFLKFTDGQSSEVRAGLVGFAGSALIFGATAVIPVQPVPQAAQHETNDRTLFLGGSAQTFGSTATLAAASVRPLPTQVIAPPQSDPTQIAAKHFGQPWLWSPAQPAPQAAQYGLSPRDLSQPSPVFSRVVQSVAAQDPPNRPSLYAAPLQSPELVQPVRFTASLFAPIQPTPSGAQYGVGPRHLYQPQPAFFGLQHVPGDVLPSNKPTPIPHQDQYQPQPWFAPKATLPSAVAVAPPNRPGLHAAPLQSIELVQPALFRASLFTPLQPAPQGAQYGVGPRDLDQPQPWFASKVPLPSVAPSNTPNRPAFYAYPLQSTEQALPVFFGTRAAYAPLLPARPPTPIPHQAQYQPQAWIASGALLPSAAPVVPVVPVAPTVFGGPAKQHLLIVYIDGRRYVGTYEQIRKLVEDFAQAQAERAVEQKKEPSKPRIVVYAGREQKSIPRSTISNQIEIRAIQTQMRDEYLTQYAIAKLQAEIDDENDFLML